MSNGGSLRISTAAKDASGRSLGRAGAVPVVIVGRDVERPRAAARPARVPENVGLLEREQAVPARLQRAHHRDARVLVGLELGQRVEDEREFHGRREAEKRHRTASHRGARSREHPPKRPIRPPHSDNPAAPESCAQTQARAASRRAARAPAPTVRRRASRGSSARARAARTRARTRRRRHEVRTPRPPHPMQPSPRPRGA